MRFSWIDGDLVDAWVDPRLVESKLFLRDKSITVGFKDLPNGCKNFNLSHFGIFWSSALKIVDLFARKRRPKKKGERFSQHKKNRPPRKMMQVRFVEFARSHWMRRRRPHGGRMTRERKAHLECEIVTSWWVWGQVYGFFFRAQHI